MLIVDGQIHLWEKGTPSPQHRQEPFSAEQAIAAMDEAGVDRALVHPVLWDPDSNELAIEAVRNYPDRFAIMGWFYLDDPKGADLVAHWKEHPGMLGLRFYFHEHLHRCFDAFGPDRMFWGTDITRMPCSWRQCVTVFTEELPWLKGRDLELVMGEALCNWVGWPLSAGSKS